MTVLEASAASIDIEGPLAAYREQGFAALGKALSDDGIEALRRRADALMLGEVVHEGLFFQHDTATGRYEDLEYGKGFVGPSLRYRKLEKLERDPLFRAWIENALFERVARAVIGDHVTLYRAVLFVKPAHGGTLLPWHQDGGSLWGLDREPELQIWTALDDAAEDAGCIEALPGTHRGGLVTPLGGIIPRVSIAAANVEERRVMLPAKAGEVLLVHNHLWHASGLNSTAEPRRGLSICYMSAETRCLRKKRAPRVFVEIFRPPAGQSA